MCLDRRTGGANQTLSGVRAVTDFGEWSDYVAASPPVLFIRATPKLVDFGYMMFGERLNWTVKEMWTNLLEPGGSQTMHSHAKRSPTRA